VLGPWYQSVDGDSSPPYVDRHVTNTDAHTGSFSASDDGNKQIEQDFAPVLGGTITQVSLWEKQPTQAAISFVQLFFSDGTTNGTVIFPTTSWSLFNITSLVDLTKYVTGIGIFGYQGGPDPNRTLIDDVTINVGAAVPEPATWAMMLFGLAGLGGMMRRCSRARIANA
jgi:hypothetical protein